MTPLMLIDGELASALYELDVDIDDFQYSQKMDVVLSKTIVALVKRLKKVESEAHEAKVIGIMR